MFSIETPKAVCNGPLSFRGCVVCMEQCESAAALLESVREQEVQFEQLTRALEEERRRVGLPATSPSALGRPLPHAQVTLPNKPSDPHPDFQKLCFSHNIQRVAQLHWGFSPLSHFIINHHFFAHTSFSSMISKCVSKLTISY